MKIDLILPTSYFSVDNFIEINSAMSSNHETEVLTKYLENINLTKLKDKYNFSNCITPLDPKRTFLNLKVSFKDTTKKYILTSGKNNSNISKIFIDIVEKHSENHFIKSKICETMKIVDAANNFYLISEYSGYTLEEILKFSKLSQNTKKQIIDYVFNIFKELLKNNLCWYGFAPRNICIYKKENYYILTFIDLEEIIDLKGTNDFDGRFFKLNWRDIILEYSPENNIFLDELYQRTHLIEEDSYDILWRNLSNCKNGKMTSLDIFNKILEIEKQHKVNDGKILGRFLSDFCTVDFEISLYLWLLEIKDKFNMLYFERTINLIMEKMVSNNIDSFYKNISFLHSLYITNIDDFSNYICGLKIKSNENELLNLSTRYINNIYSLRKSDIADSIIKLLLRYHDTDTNILVLARGTYGLQILSEFSDLDFEIYPCNNKNNDIEVSLIKTLNLLGIPCEGRYARPNEKDLFIFNDSREFEEAYELRDVLESGHFKELQKKLIDAIDLPRDYYLSMKRPVNLSPEYNYINIKEVLKAIRRIHRWYYLEKKLYPETFEKWISNINDKDLKKSIACILEMRNFFKRDNIHISLISVKYSRSINTVINLYFKLLKERVQ